jgi:hypothetical protein
MLSTNGAPKVGGYRREVQKIQDWAFECRKKGNAKLLKPVLYFLEPKYGADASGKNLSEPTRSKEDSAVQTASTCSHDRIYLRGFMAQRGSWLPYRAINRGDRTRYAASRFQSRCAADSGQQLL